jgi:hypothetical protein
MPSVTAICTLPMPPAFNFQCQGGMSNLNDLGIARDFVADVNRPVKVHPGNSDGNYAPFRTTGLLPRFLQDPFAKLASPRKCHREDWCPSASQWHKASVWNWAVLRTAAQGHLAILNS